MDYHQPIDDASDPTEDLSPADSAKLSPPPSSKPTGVNSANDRPTAADCSVTNTEDSQQTANADQDSETTQPLIELMQQEIITAQTVQRLMQDEQQAIKQRQLKTLEQLTTTKATVIKQLQQQAEARLTWLHQHQLPLTAHCLTIPPLSDCESSKVLWQTLADVYADNRQQSEELADIVLTLRRRTQKKLELLRGQINGSPLYNQTGGTQAGNQSLGSVKA